MQPLKERSEIIRLAREENQTPSQIAKILDLPVGKIKNAFAYANRAAKGKKIEKPLNRCRSLPTVATQQVVSFDTIADRYFAKPSPELSAQMLAAHRSFNYCVEIDNESEVYE